MITLGAKQLKQHLRKTGTSQRIAGAALGVSGPTVHDWIHGVKRPRLLYREAIAAWSGGVVAVDAWDRLARAPAEEPSVPAVVIDVVPIDAEVPS